MKKLLALSLCAAMIITSCSEENFVSKPERKITEKISAFLAQPANQNLTMEKRAERLHQFMLANGYKPDATRPSDNERDSRSAREAECTFGKVQWYRYGDFESVGVTPFTGCDTLCPSGDGFLVVEEGYVNGEYTITHSTQCAPQQYE